VENFLWWINTTIYFTSLLSKGTPPIGGTNSFFRAARIYNLQTSNISDNLKPYQ